MAVAVAVAVAVPMCEERGAEPALRDQVLAGANGGHLRSNGVHVLTQGNPMFLRLVPIGVKPGGKRMNLVAES